MFRTKASIDAELSQRKLTMILARLDRSDDRWFNGTLGAVDGRLRQVDSALRFARGVTARIGSTEAGHRAADVLPRLESHRLELVALRDDLLNGASNRRGDTARTGRRFANVTAAGPSPFAPTVGEVPQQASPPAANGPGRDRRDEPMDGRFEHSQVQEWPPGSGQGWMPTPGGPSHLHPVHGPYSPNPQVYPGPHPTSAADPMPVPKQIGLPFGGPGRKASRDFADELMF